MCLALPAKVIAFDVEQQSAKVDLSGVLKTVSTVLLENVAIGDYLLVHVGFALNTIDPESARKTLVLFEQAGLVGLDESL